MRIRANKTALLYSACTIAFTFLVGKIILLLFPQGDSLGASILFILINLLPMIIAIVFTMAGSKQPSIGCILKDIFIQKESFFAYLLSMGAVCVYYGVSATIGNVHFTGEPLGAILAYMPWTILQGGLEEVGWRWYLQPQIKTKSFVGKMLIISVIWFVWHIPIYRLPWITSASSNYLIFYFMILGNTFMFGTIKEFSKSAVPCVLAHILIDTLAVAMLVQSNLLPIVVLVTLEIIGSWVVLKMKKMKF